MIHAIAEFGTKADTLERFRPHLRSASILPSECVRYLAWVSNPDTVLIDIGHRSWGRQPLIVRSSATAEDQPDASCAGCCRTEFNVAAGAELQRAIDRVFASYPVGLGRGPLVDDQVLIQPMVTDALFSGVASGRDHASGGAYRVVNWTYGDDTAAVTSGRPVDTRTAYWIAGRTPPESAAPLRQIDALLDEVETLVGSDRFELEFAVSRSLGVVVFQIRRLAAVVDSSFISAQLLLTPIADAVEAAMRASASGLRTVFGVMPDWNPAEMIGLRPRRLARSLYQYLITDNVWSSARKQYGYRHVPDIPLMLVFEGFPYIDVRASVSSLIPATLPDSMATRLANFYIDKLVAAPELHDKLEFDLVLSSWVPGCDASMERHLGGVLSRGQRRLFAEELRRLTARIIAPTGPWRADLSTLHGLTKNLIAATSLADGTVEQIAAILTSTRRYGTLPFAGLARAAFVATQILHHAVGNGVLSPGIRDGILASASGMTTDFVREFGQLDRGEFLTRYGHLRPGTYDILVPRYDEDPERYFKWTTPATSVTEHNWRNTVVPDIGGLVQTLTVADLDTDVDHFLAFVRHTVHGREYAKFEFSRGVSDALRAIARWGEIRGLSVEELSHLEIGDVLADRPTTLLHELIAEGRAERTRSQRITLPPLITGPDDIWSHELPCGSPNFITSGIATGQTADVENGEEPGDRIAFIRCADPGFDWIFARGIRGLITAYGGVNSHMAIRAREFDIPTVTGVGEVRYGRWLAAHRLQIDAGSRLVRVMS